MTISIYKIAAIHNTIRSGKNNRSEKNNRPGYDNRYEKE